jgi:predicted membrane-bound spermidine synthase/Flp pilus assembly protein TadD
MQNEKAITSEPAGFSPILIPVATVFISSFCVMVLEMVAGRMIARHLGSSLYTWTAVIGVVLAGITIGNYIGGRIADKFESRKALSLLFVTGSIACVLIVVFGNLVSEWLFLWKFGWPFRVFSHTSIMFLLPSTLLGAFTPLAAKMALEKGLSKGRTVGDIYAWGAAGSIAGTLTAGYYLIPALGTIPLIWIIAGVLALLAIICRLRFWKAYLWLAVFAFLLAIAALPVDWCQKLGGALLLREAIDPRVIYHDESQYCYIAVQQLSTVPDRRAFMQDKLRHSDIIMGNINDLQYAYTRIYASITRLISKNKDKLSVMVIGGGGYVYPRYIEHNWPGSRIEVVEIDPRVTEAAMQAFGLHRDTTINTIWMDARNYVDELLEKQKNGRQIPLYDFIYEDAFSDFSVPYQLVTKEFHDKIFKILTDDGAYMVNLIDTFDNGLFLGAIINTLQETFPHVYVTANKMTHPAVRETFVVTATKQPFDIKTIEREKDIEILHLSESEMDHLKKKASGIVMTDDYVPIENLLAPVVLQSSKEMLVNRYIKDAKVFNAAGKWNRSIRAYENAVRVQPIMTLLAYNEIGIMQANQNKFREAAMAFQKAIDYYNDNQTGYKEKVIASVYMNLGILLQKMGRNEDANQVLNKAVEEFRLELADKPNDALLWSRLGDTFGTMGDFKSATDAFEKVIALDPGNMTDRFSLAKMLEFQGRLSEAVEVTKKALDIASVTGQQKMTSQLNEYLKFLKQKTTQQQQ